MLRFTIFTVSSYEDPDHILIGQEGMKKVKNIFKITYSSTQCPAVITQFLFNSAAPHVMVYIPGLFFRPFPSENSVAVKATVL